MLGMTGCNSKEDVSLSTVEKITNYVERVIDEPVRYEKTVELKEDRALYIYELEDRGIEFEVEAYIKADFFEALQLSDYREVIEIRYEEAIMKDNFYVEERLKLAEKHKISDVLYNDSGDLYFYMELQEFSELEKAAKYIKELDALYSFKEKKLRK